MFQQAVKEAVHLKTNKLKLKVMKKEFKMLVNTAKQAEDVMLRFVDAGLSKSTTVSCWAKETPNGKHLVTFIVTTK